MFRQRIWNLVYANLLYPKGREGFLDGSIDWDTNTIKAGIVLTAYTYSSAHDNLDDLGANVLASGTLASKTVTDGVADAADLTLSAVSGGACSYIVIWKDTGTPSTSRLIAYIDTATGLPITPNGGDITIQWSNGSDKIFKL